MHNYYNLDNTIFKLISYAWLQGEIPYVDIFDHKGPYLYLIDALGLYMSKKWGIFFLEFLNLWLFLELLYRTGRYIITCKTPIYIGIAFVLLMFLHLFEGGNFCEEWCLVPTIIPVYLYFKVTNRNLDKQQYIIPYSYPLIIGLCFGLCAWLRLNNTILIICVVLSIAVLLIFNTRQYNRLIKSIIYFILGASIASLPILAIYYSESALDELWFCNIEFNFEYLQKWGGNSTAIILSNIRRLSPCFLLLFITLLWWKRFTVSERLLYIISSILFILLMIKSNGYFHYFLLTLPLCFFLAISLFKISRSCAIGTAILIGVFLLYCPSQLVLFYNFKSVNNYIDFQNIENMVKANVPLHESTKLYSYGLKNENSVLYNLEIIPDGKFLILHDNYKFVSDKIKFEIEDYHHKGNPQFILLGIAPKDIKDDTFIEMLERYSLIDSTSYNTEQTYLYQRNEY